MKPVYRWSLIAGLALALMRALEIAAIWVVGLAIQILR